MISVHDDLVHSEEFYVMGMGNPKPITEIGSSVEHRVIAGNELEGKTMISFSMPVEKTDDKHYSLKKGDTIWLICAYSMEDEFDHHS